MSTDVGKLILGGGLVALGFVPGLQLLQPTGISVGLSGLGGLIRGSPRPGRKNLGGRQQAQLISNHSVAGTPIPVVYGAVKLGVVINDYRVDTSIPTDLYLPAVLSHGSRDSLGIASVDEIYFDDRLAFDASAVVQAPFTSGTAAVTKILGTTTQNWGATVVGAKSLSDVKAADWSSTTDKGAALAGFIVKLTFNTDIYATGVPVVTAQLKGNLIEDTRSKVSGISLTYNATGKTITRATGSYVTDGYVAKDRVDSSGSASNNSAFTINTVTATVLTVDETVVDEGPTSAPTLKRWAHPDNGGDNPAMCVRDYLLSTIYGLGLAEADLDTASFETIANYCDDSVVAPPGNQKRYTCNGWIDVSRSIATVLTELLSSFRGNPVYEGGVFRLFSTRSVTPSTIALTKDNIVGDWQFTNAGAAQKFNVARATFIDPTRNFMPELAQWPNPGATNTFLTDDNSWENRLEIDLPFTNDIYRAEQTMMTLLKESRQGIAVMVTCTEEALQLQIGDVVPVTHETPGWASKNFSVMGVDILSDTRVRLALLEYDANAYSLDAEVTAPAEPDTDLPDPFTVGAPTGLTLTATSAESIETDAGVYIPRIKVTWTDSTDAFVDHYEIEAKLGTEATFDPWGTAPPGQQLFFVYPVTPVSWDVRIRSVNSLGVKSAFISTSVTPAVSLPIIDAMPLSRDVAGQVRVVVSTCAALSVRVAGSKSAFPSEATTRAASATNTDSDGAADINNILQLDPGENAFISAFAYELVAGGGRESTPLSKAILQRPAIDEQKSAQTQTLQDFQILQRDPDVAHGMTDLVETNIHAAIGFVNALLGGVNVMGFTEGASVGALIQGLGVTGGNSAVQIEGWAKSGSGRTAVSGATPVLSVLAGTAVVFRVFADSFNIQKQFYASQVAVAASDLDWNLSNSQTITNSGARTITTSNEQSGGVYVLRILRAASAASSWTWPTAVKWVGGTAPTLSTAASRVDIISFYYDGTRFLGVANTGFNV